MDKPAIIERLRGRRVSLAHDWLVGLRGGELVLDRLARLFGPTDLYTLVSDGRFLTEAIAACAVHTSPLQRLPGASGRWRRHYLPLMPWAVERIRVEPCDLLISTSSAVMKSIVAPQGTPHLCYCHSPARYLWEQTDAYATGAGGRLRNVGLRAFRGWFQRWDRATADRPTRFLANSRFTADRIKRFLGRDADVVYPPVRTAFFTPDPTVRREDWLLVVAALEPYKRTDVVIKAANQEGLPLKVAGDGTQFAALRALAGPTVQLLGRVGDHRLRDLYRRAAALIFAQQEDFGITAIEAQATGCPVVAYTAGGALETVSEQTGVFFNRQEPEAVIDAVVRLRRTTIDAAHCRASAERFSQGRFDTAILEHAAALMGLEQFSSKRSGRSNRPRSP